MRGRLFIGSPPYPEPGGPIVSKHFVGGTAKKRFSAGSKQFGELSSMTTTCPTPALAVSRTCRIYSLSEFHSTYPWLTFRVLVNSAGSTSRMLIEQ